MKNPHEFTTMLWPTIDNKNTLQKPIAAADGWPGLVLLLAYYGGGKNLFPENAKPDFFWLSKTNNDGHIHISPEGLQDLGDAYYGSIGRKVKPLMTSSLKEYLLALKKGRRANNSAQLPALPDLSFHRNEDPPRIEIPPRDYDADEAEGLTVLIPPDIFPVKPR